MTPSLNPTEHSPYAAPHSALDADAVRTAYRRWATVYDATFGEVSARGRRAAVAAVNALPGRHVL